MNIYQKDNLSTRTVAQDVEVVICIGLDSHYEILLEKDVAKPDRHFLVGLIQLCTVAVEEKDSEVVVFAPGQSVILEMNDRKNVISSGIVVFRTSKGHIRCICLHDATVGRRVMRVALRSFTGTIRLDIP